MADAILGPLGYRVLLECKTAKTIVSQPDAAEVAKFHEPFNAQRCVLVGPDFSGELELLGELQTHRVCALSVGVLQTLLHIGADALEVARVLEPGFSSDLIGDVLWERRHGAAKRVSTVAELIVREGWRAQVTAAEQGGAANAPRLTVDAATVLVDAALQELGSTQACTRAEVEDTFAWLTSPANAVAVRDGDGIVVVRASEHVDARGPMDGSSPNEPASARCRTEILQAARRFHELGWADFSPDDIVRALRDAHSQYAESTIRTQVVSVMCVDAPPNHGTRFPDLQRVERGRYRIRTDSQ